MRVSGERLDAFLADDESLTTYVARMSADGVWGDHVALLAIASALGVAVNVVTGNTGGELVVVEPLELPPSSTPSRTLLLCHWAEFHYGSLEAVRTKTSASSSTESKRRRAPSR